MKIQPAVPAFLAVANSFAVQGDWAIAFCRQIAFFFPGPKGVELNQIERKQILNWANKRLKSNSECPLCV